MAARSERRSVWTWGYVSDEPSDAQRKAAAKGLSSRLGAEVVPPQPADLERVALPPSRLTVPAPLAPWTSTSAVERATHTYGGHGLELLKGLRGEFDHPPP